MDFEKVKSVDYVKPEPVLLSVADSSPKTKKKATSLEANQISIDDALKIDNNKQLKIGEIIEGKAKNEGSTDKPIFDFRKDHMRSKNKKQATNTMRSKEKINKATNIETDVKKNTQKPLFDFRKK